MKDFANFFSTFGIKRVVEERNNSLSSVLYIKSCSCIFYAFDYIFWQKFARECRYDNIFFNDIYKFCFFSLMKL